ENDPGSILMERVLSTAFLWHGYGFATIGPRSDIERVPIDRLQAFYKRYYQPDNAMLIVAGKIEPASTLKLVAEIFGKIPRPARELPRTYTVEPTQDGERTVTLRRVGDVQWVMSVYHVPPGSHPDFAAVEILCDILADSPSGRLYKPLVESGKAASIFGGAFQLRDPGMAIFGAEVRKDAPLDPVKDTLISVVEQFPQTVPTTEEVERARATMLKVVELTLNQSERLALQLSEWEAMGDWRLFFLYRDRLEKVTVADVQRVAQLYLKPSNRTLGIFLPTDNPERAQVPETPDVQAMVKDYQGRAPIAQGEAFDASCANIEARTRRVTLPGGGIKLALLPKKTRGETVQVTMIFRFGSLDTLQNQDYAGLMAGSMLMRGTAKHTREQLQDELDRLKARMNVGGGATSASVSIETTRANLPKVLELAAEVLRSPAFPESEFKTLKEQRLANLESSASDPEYLASDARVRYLDPYPKGDPRYPETIAEALANSKAVQLADAVKFYRTFYGASNAQIAVVGDFDAAAVEAQVGRLLGDWKSPQKFERLVNQYFDRPAVSETVFVADKANVVLAGGMNLKVRNDDPDYPALVLGNYLLGGGFLNSRLAVRIRQKEGLSYGVGSQLSADSQDAVGQFTFYAICAPENAARVDKAFREELARVLQEGYTAEEVKAGVEGLLQVREGQRAKDGSLASRLATYLYLDRTLEYDQKFDDRLRSLTPDEIRQAMARHLDPSRVSMFKAGTVK
ncbi:MAG: insulinase family protein, partial [Candidatus Eremiobacterota bacterium]